MGLGDKAAAFAFVDKGIALVPIEKDAIDGTIPIEILARVAAKMGEPGGAIAALQKLLVTPGSGADGIPLTPRCFDWIQCSIRGIIRVFKTRCLGGSELEWQLATRVEARERG